MSPAPAERAAWWAPHAWVEDGPAGAGASPADALPRLAGGVRLEASGGVITAVEVGVAARAGDTVLDGVVHPGAVDAHSHAFHRLLRGRTHGDGGTFWTWRHLMYERAARLDPETYQAVATALYAEMVAAGWTSVAEFHYLHHDPAGRPYTSAHAMELALVRAALAAGIRLTLLDTAYLAGGFGAAVAGVQQRFTDGSAQAWLERVTGLRAALEGFDPALVRLGAALHSVRAVPVDALPVIAAGLAGAVGRGAPLHVHLSEQVAENVDCLAATGRTPAALLDAHGLLGPGTCVVHATHLTEADVALLGARGATAVVCPTTEADLGDGIGPARALADAGAVLALGTDQHAVVDPLLEARALEHGERLASRSRGRFSPAELVAASSRGGAVSVGRTGATGPAVGSLRPGAACDFFVVDPASSRTAGSHPGALVLSATAADVRLVVVGARTLARDGVHVVLGRPGDLLLAATGGLR